jgi:hypothetical protein
VGSLGFRPHYGLGVNWASNRNKYQGYLLGGKGGRCVGLTTLRPSCADCLEILGASTSWSPKGLSRNSFTFLRCWWNANKVFNTKFECLSLCEVHQCHHFAWFHVDEICAPLGYYVAFSGISVPTFRDNLSVLSSRIKKSKKNFWPLKIGPIGCPETSIHNY